MSVRKARVEHTGAVQELYETLFPADGPFKAWATPDVIWFVALDDKKVVGFAGVRFIRRSKTAELVISGVATTHQGRGIQRRLISARERAARKVGMTRAVSYTIPQNAPSATNLAKRGYSTYRPKTAWSGRRSVVYWEKRL
ncbi:GNAT family N-acetyltransferase [Reyranella sp.]|uniref:GNAT family N-acetyltransferase n=1 Tax=Reyranella sp. TaxID=1929291 RepID=UPI0025ED3F6A|nr:GNAT family N-acetyltransferase [Reyranella sp.]